MKKRYTLTFDDYVNTNSYTTTISSEFEVQFTQTTTNDKLENNGN